MNLIIPRVDGVRRAMWPVWRQERAERRAWRRAVDWPELCELMASYVESLDGVPDEQAQMLARVNRAGYLVHVARPGSVWRDGEGVSEQRASVFGFVFSLDLYEALARVAEAHGLIFLSRSVRDHDEVPGEFVVRVDGVDSVQIGESKSVATLRDDWQHLGLIGRGLVYAVRQVTVIDPVWGRDDRLRQALGEAVDLYEAAA